MTFQSDSLVESIGICIHTGFSDTPYVDSSKVLSFLQDLGLRYVRDDFYLNRADQWAAINKITAAGIKFNLIVGKPNETDFSPYPAALANVKPDTLEGLNEMDISGYPDWATRANKWQAALNAYSKVPTLSPSMAFSSHQVPFTATYANGHFYTDGMSPSFYLDQNIAAVKAGINKPLFVTETGYTNALNNGATPSAGHMPVPEDISANYVPKIMLENYLRGNKRVYIYELIDEFADSAMVNTEAHFGLVRHDLTTKPAYNALKNMIALTRDPGRAFTPKPLNYKVSGNVKQLLFQRRGGKYVLFLWSDTQQYDPATKVNTPMIPATSIVSLDRNFIWNHYKPNVQAGPVDAGYGNIITIPIDEQVTAIELS